MDHSRRTVLFGVPALAAAALLAPTGAAAAATPRHGGAAAGRAGGAGKQSPIDIRPREAVLAPELPDLAIDYPREVDVRIRYVSRDPANDPTGCSARGREETIEAEVPEGAAAVTLGGVRYGLVQFHFHTPSEHLVNGERFPVEQHFVHRGPNGETLVLGLFLVDGGSGDALQDAVLRELPAECGPEAEAGGDLAASLPRDRSTFRYDGSLTTSPHTEGVSWLVLQHPFTVAVASIDRFRGLFPEGDAREPQPLNGRVVQYRPQPA